MPRDSSVQSVPCCSRLRGELSSPFFSLVEPDGSIIDVEETFAPKPVFVTACFRLVFLGASVATFVYKFFYLYPEKNRFIFFAYLTHWTLALSMVYQLMSLYCTVVRSSLAQPEASATEKRPTFPVRFMWGMYSVVAPAGIIVMVTYWVMDYNPESDEINIQNVMVHGGIASLVWADGLFVGLIPLRMKQFLYSLILVVTFITWSIIHDFSGIGDGDWEGEDSKDEAEDSLYPVLSWSTNFKGALTISLFQIFFFVPAAFMICWTLSLWSKWCKFDGSRRPTYSAGSASYDKMGGIAAWNKA